MHKTRLKSMDFFLAMSYSWGPWGSLKQSDIVAARVLRVGRMKLQTVGGHSLKRSGKSKLQYYWSRLNTRLRKFVSCWRSVNECTDQGCTCVFRVHRKCNVAHSHRRNAACLCDSLPWWLSSKVLSCMTFTERRFYETMPQKNPLVQLLNCHNCVLEFAHAWRVK